MTSTRRLVGGSNKLFAQLLLHLAEVETRGIHRTRACASLYTYCIYELRMSEDAAARRSSAARLVKRFPLLFDAIGAGELHLTGLLMLGPHLTLENHVEVLARAKFRTKKEIAQLVRELQPLPRVPDLVQPLGPELPRSPRNPTWNEWVRSLCPPVRELDAGESPRDWANDANDGAETEADAKAEPGAEAEARAAARVEEEAEAGERLGRDPATGADGPFTALARRQLSPITAPQQYQVQFSTTEEHVRLVERAKALLARSSPGVSLGELHRQAMQLLVDRLEKEKFGKPQEPPPPEAADCATQPEQAGAEPRQRGGVATDPRPRPSAPPRQRGGKLSDVTRTAPQPGRHIPAAVKREVFSRDEGCCGYVDERGQRCGETRYLELHHLKPFARGGEHLASNLALRCAAHNALAAEQDFGRNDVELKRDTGRHESFSSQAPPEFDHPQ
ncbi:MAG TPA: HNH endonuclease [Polyangiaceae bacterium]